jgi:hypothetical protein
MSNSLGLSSQFSEMMNHEKIAQSLSGVSMISQVTKGMQQQHKLFENPALSAIEIMTKGLGFQPKFAIPQTTIDAITSINRQHAQLFGGFKSISETLKIQTSAIAQVNNLKFALSGISGQIAAIAAQQRNWTIIDDFEEVTEQAIEFSENLTPEVTEEQQRQFQVLLTLVTIFLKKYGIQGFLVIDIILRFAGLHQYYDFLQQTPELPTKQEVNQIAIKQDSIIQFIVAVNAELKNAKEYRITKRQCDVKLKPKTKSLTVTKIPVDYELVVLQINHKWVLVSYFDPKDNLPQTGWIMKKYLNKPK